MDVTRGYRKSFMRVKSILDFTVGFVGLLDHEYVPSFGLWGDLGL